MAPATLRYVSREQDRFESGRQPSLAHCEEFPKRNGHSGTQGTNSAYMLFLDTGMLAVSCGTGWGRDQSICDEPPQIRLPTQ